MKPVRRKENVPLKYVSHVHYSVSTGMRGVKTKVRFF